ncbi:MAG TPA: sigma-70 family RNA polymerase sigma factor [Thermoanaerobaculia bacterium]|nr:sigma-70 family RNA polymerase sigma factor [Thermoanaerobaculia bacterium]
MRAGVYHPLAQRPRDGQKGRPSVGNRFLPGYDGSREPGISRFPREAKDQMAVSDQPAGRESIDQLLRRLRPRLKQVLGRYRIPAHDAEDLIQEALISTIQKWETIQDPEAWLLVTLRNRCVVYWRKRRNTLYNSVDTAILELLSEPVAAPQERAELLWDLNNLLEELPPRCRKLLQLRYGLGYDSSEVAEKMGYHPSSVRKVARRCMAALTYQMVTRGFTRDSF